MKTALICMAAAWVAMGSMSAEVVVEFDAERKSYSEDFKQLDEEALKQGLCIVAPQDGLMKDIFKDELFFRLRSFPLRYEVRGQAGHGITLKPMPENQWQGVKWLMIIMEGGTATAVVSDDPYRPDVFRGPKERAFMDKDGTGGVGFYGLIKQYVNDRALAGQLPRVGLVVRSATTYGEVIDLWRLIQKAECHHGVMLIDDFIPSMKIDARIGPADDEPQDAWNARLAYIPLFIHEDGTIKADRHTVLPDEQAIMDWVSAERKRCDADGCEARLFIRMAKQSAPRWREVVLKQAAAAGVVKGVCSFMSN